jgi:DeoR/GlpR family transcriptional regulator of sugar metabolism
MYDHCVQIHKLLTERKRISIHEIASQLNTSEATVRRWLTSFSTTMDLRIERGVVVIGE